ncbi:MAG: hypothetical protein Q4C42_10815 [Clostridia bacterium]|nr:hypothetical protein [Clostridia bacterium]
MKKNNTLRKMYRGILSVMCVFMIMYMMLPTSVFAESSEGSEKRIRVGWYQSNMFQEGTTDEEVKWGYSYIYLQKIADYTSWEYEYVYGGWSELLHMLETGEIDVMAGVSSTE